MFFCVLGLPMLVACQQNDLAEISSELNPLSMEAEISGASNNVISRTNTTHEGNVSFSAGDKIGFYMPEAETAGEWSYSGSNWTSSVNYEWKDKVMPYHFCAFYPSVESAPRTAIPMPDLSLQTGTWEDLGQYDFLVAHNTSKYTDKSGVVSFTGESAFKHVYAMVSITLKKDKEEEQVTLSDITFEAPGIVTPHTYQLGNSAMEDAMSISGDAVDTFTLPNISNDVPTEGCNKVFIVNPLELEDPINLLIKYNRDGISYSASTKALGTNLKKGSFYNLTLRLKKSGLVVEGNTVEDWNLVNMDDVNVEEIPTIE